MSDESLLVDRATAAAMLGLKSRTLDAWAYRKQFDLPMVKFGGKVMYLRSDVIDYIHRHRVGGPAPLGQEFLDAHLTRSEQEMVRHGVNELLEEAKEEVVDLAVKTLSGKSTDEVLGAAGEEFVGQAGKSVLGKARKFLEVVKAQFANK